MKTIRSLLVGSLVLAGSVATSQAWFAVGSVYCDANTDGVIDAGDFPVPSVLVVVTNASGTFSNANWTTVQGRFVVQLPAGADTYVGFILGATLPPGTISVTPQIATFQTDATDTILTNNFLIEDAGCISPPSPGTNGPCWLTGGGTTRVGRGQPAHTFGGVVYPGCHALASHGGNWNDIDHHDRLQFKAVQIDVVTCGNVPGYPAGSRSPRTPFNFIDFEGVGILRGIGGNHTNDGFVQFYARCEDHREPGRGSDRYFLRVTDGQGNVLMLVSTDQADPTDIAPVVISSGNLQLHVSGCGH